MRGVQGGDIATSCLFTISNSQQPWQISVGIWTIHNIYHFLLFNYLSLRELGADWGGGEWGNSPTSSLFTGSNSQQPWQISVGIWTTHNIYHFLLFNYLSLRELEADWGGSWGIVLPPACLLVVTASSLGRSL